MYDRRSHLRAIDQWIDRARARGRVGQAEAPLDIQASLFVIVRRRADRDRASAVLDLSSTDLRYAYLLKAKLNGVFFFATNLCGAFLNDASLVGANLMGAVLYDADLRGADLSDALLEHAVLQDARYDSKTRWPTGFDPKTNGAQLIQ